MNSTTQMSESQRALWARLEDFSLDEPGAVLPFSRRLARENGWSPGYARRAMAEYKRFVFLAMEAGHMVSPSEAVDQVWHLHLVFTESYWQRMCGEVCGRRLHHHPTKGGGREAQKFDTMYAQTLESYRRFFGSEPPADIWTPAELRDHAAPQLHRWVDLSQNWVLPKRFAAPAALAIFAVLVLTGLGGCERSELNVFDYSGPTFLRFFIPAALVGFAVAHLLRRFMARPHGEPHRTDLQLDPYELAYLAGGAQRVLQAALISLHARGAISIESHDTVRVARASEPEQPLHDIEVLVWGSLPEDKKLVKLDAVRDALGAATEQIEARLLSAGLLSAAHREATLAATFVASVVPAIGALKILVGLSRGRPVAFLVMLCAASAVVVTLLVSRWRRQHRSGRGQRTLTKLQELHPRAEFTASSDADGSTGNPAMATALFGLAVLPVLGMGSLETLLQPRRSLGDLAGGSGCGTSCGGGGGDGGGGCGGGGSGCGGCGGGGGD